MGDLLQFRHRRHVSELRLAAKYAPMPALGTCARCKCWIWAGCPAWQWNAYDGSRGAACDECWQAHGLDALGEGGA